MKSKASNDAFWSIFRPKYDGFFVLWTLNGRGERGAASQTFITPAAASHTLLTPVEALYSLLTFVEASHTLLTPVAASHTLRVHRLMCKGY